MMLNSLVKLTKKRKRVGRGGGRGGTSGRGHDGQNVRTGDRQGPVFEGGQMPLIRRLPKRGFSNVAFARKVEIVNLKSLADAFELGATVQRQDLIEKGLIRGKKGALVKILGKGILSKKLIVHADAFSEMAKNAIEKAGGEAHITMEK